MAELVKALFECMPAFRLSHAWVVRDLTPIVTIDRRVGWTLSLIILSDRLIRLPLREAPCGLPR
jgi:hypothetical protein